MQLTRIVLNLADYHARADLADAYEMHSTLSRAFTVAGGQVVGRFLWRQEPARPGEPAMVLVQSIFDGAWSRLLAAKPGWATRVESRNWDPGAVLRSGQALQFRLRANPTVTRERKRRALLKEADQCAWLARQFERAGLTLRDAAVRETVRLAGKRRKESGAVIVNAVLYEGVASVVEPAAVAAALGAGLGHAKMMGLGLLSVAPAVR